MLDCLVVFDFYFDYPNFNDFGTEQRIHKGLNSTENTQEEDTHICESVQRGMNSMSFEFGRYSEQFEKAVHAFHIKLWEELNGGGF